MKFKLFKKILSFILSLSIIINPLFVPLTILAEEGITPTPTPTIIEENQNPVLTPTPTIIEENNQTPNLNTITPTETPTPTPTLSSETGTGDAVAVSQTETTANYNENNTTGNLETGECTVSGSINCPIENSNNADISGNSSSEAVTGENQTENQNGNASINSGDAAANSTSINLLNTNIVEISPTPEISPEITPTASGENNINIENNVSLNTQNSSQSISGENNVCSSNNVDINSGNSYSSTAAVNLVNTNLIGSNYRFLIYNIYGNETKNINLNDIYKEIEKQVGENEGISESANGALLISLKNSSQVINELSAIAISGGNSGSGNKGNVNIVTGNSYASANLFNLINTNVIGAKFLFVVVNIFGTLNGNIIVPSKDRFAEAVNNLNSEKQLLSAESISINNYANIESALVSAEANSGSNNENNNNGNSNINTNTAYASATTIDVVNTTLAWEDWMHVIVNNYGEITGNLEGWSDPSSSEVVKENTTNSLDFSAGNTDGNEAKINTDANEEKSEVVLDNSVDLKNIVLAKAVSGENEANSNGGNVSIITGFSKAVASAVNFVNTNIIGSNIVLLVINIFGKLNGSIIDPHPDLTVSLSPDGEAVNPGQEKDYTIYYSNNGFLDARNAKIKISLPNNISYLSNSLGTSPEINGNEILFTIGNVVEKSSGSFTIKVKINNSISSNSIKNNFWQKISGMIVKSAYASENEKTLLISSNIFTNDPEINIKNNSFSITVNLVLPENDNNSSNSNIDKPLLEVETWHNVNDFVYPGDTVRFEITIKNNGKGIAKDVVFHQNIFDGGPLPIASIVLNIGDIEASKATKITYGLTIPKNTIPDLYKSIAYAEGNSESGIKTTSEKNEKRFLVKEKGFSFGEEVYAGDGSLQNKKSVKVLGTAIASPCKNDNDKYLPFVLSFSLAALWFTEFIRRKRAEQELSDICKEQS